MTTIMVAHHPGESSPQWVPARTPAVHWGHYYGRPWVARHQCHKWQSQEAMTHHPDSTTHMSSDKHNMKYANSLKISTQNPGRFPWFAVVVVSFFDEIIDDVHDDVFSECVFPKECQQPILRSHRFSERKWQFSLVVKQKHTFHRRKSTRVP